MYLTQIDTKNDQPKCPGVVSGSSCGLKMLLFREFLNSLAGSEDIWTFVKKKDKFFCSGPLATSGDSHDGSIS